MNHLRVFRRRRANFRTYGLITLVCALISVVFHLLSSGLTEISSVSEQLINQATQQAVSDQIQKASQGN